MLDKMLNSRTKRGQVKRGEIYYANLEANGSIQGGLRPVIVISNNKCNAFSPVITIIPLTTSNTKHKLPTHVFIKGNNNNLRDSIALCEQIQSINKMQLHNEVITVLSKEILNELEKAIQIQLDIDNKVKQDTITIKDNFIKFTLDEINQVVNEYHKTLEPNQKSFYSIQYKFLTENLIKYYKKFKIEYKNLIPELLELIA